MKRRGSGILLLATLSGAAFASGPPSAPGAPPERPRPDPMFFDPRRPPERELDLSIGDGFTLAAVGGCIISRPLATMLKTDEGFAAVARIVREADAAFGNMETPIVDLRAARSEPAPGPSEAGDHLVRDQLDAVAVAQRAQSAGEARRQGDGTRAGSTSGIPTCAPGVTIRRVSRRWGGSRLRGCRGRGGRRACGSGAPG